MKPVSRRILAISGAITAAVGLILLTAWLSLPRWIEERLVPDLAGRLGLVNAGLEVRRIGLSGFDAARIHIGQVLTLDHLTADFKLRALAKGRIERILLSGLTLRAVWDEAGIHLVGIGPIASGSPSQRTGPPPVWIGRVEIRDGLLVVEHASTFIEIPFSLTALAEDEDLTRISARLVLFPHLGPVQVMMRADTSKGDLNAAVEARDARLDLFNPFLPASAGMYLHGRLTARAEAHLGLSPFEIRSLNGEVASTDWCIRGPAFELAASEDPEPLRLAWSATQGHDRVATLSGALKLVRPLAASARDIEITAALLGGASGREGIEIGGKAAFSCGPPWNAQVERLSFKSSGRLEGDGWPSGTATLQAEGRIAHPLPLAVDHLMLTATGGGQGVDVSGDFVVTADGDNLPAGVKVVPTTAKGSIRGRFDALDRWQAHLEAAPSRTSLNLSANGLSVRIQRPRMDIDISGASDAIAYTARFISREGRLEPGKTAVTWPELRADLSGKLDLADLTAGSGARFGIQMFRPAAGSDTWEAGSEKVTLQGRLRPGRRPMLTAEMRADKGRFAWPAQGVAAEKISLRLPLQWPAGNPSAGRLSIDLLRWQEGRSGRLNATVRQKGSGLVLDGALKDIFLEGLDLKLAAEVGLTEAGIGVRLDTTLDPWSPPAPIDLGLLLPAASGLSVDGQLALNSTLTLGAGDLQGHARLQLTGASLAVPDQEVRLTGITTDLEIVDLTHLRSAPGQILHLDRAELGSIVASDARIQFQIEAPEQILLERGAFGWCGGRVYAEATRFSPAVKDYELTLFCDRLYLAQILEQLGGLSAEGQGTVNGRIPMYYSQGNLRFSDGFLYSTPGVGGKIRVTGIERLTEGMGPETLEYAQLALASEALKDYDYKWAKVGVDSQGGNLALRLQFDGTPANPLPFVYEKELGRFVRVTADAPGSRFQGIHLDVNLGLPLDQILKYGGLMKMIQ